MAKLTLRCTSCNWKFRRVYEPKLCPNCGKATVEKDKRQGASDILRELDEMQSGFDR
ncbi:hypothetical protein GF342_00110 [Candidatus Woesearchaeota archaeon]|nr:hypothetical protein [Candidatus Woesearchaeota archaeon]